MHVVPDQILAKISKLLLHIRSNTSPVIFFCSPVSDFTEDRECDRHDRATTNHRGESFRGQLCRTYGEGSKVHVVWVLTL